MALEKGTTHRILQVAPKPEPWRTDDPVRLRPPFQQTGEAAATTQGQERPSLSLLVGALDVQQPFDEMPVPSVLPASAQSGLSAGLLWAVGRCSAILGSGDRGYVTA